MRTRVLLCALLVSAAAAAPAAAAGRLVPEPHCTDVPDACVSHEASAEEADVAAHASSRQCEEVAEAGCAAGAGVRAAMPSAANPVTASCSRAGNRVTVKISAVMVPPRKVATFVTATCTLVEQNRFRGSVTAESNSSNATGTATVDGSESAARCLTYFVRWNDNSTSTSGSVVRPECEIIHD